MAYTELVVIWSGVSGLPGYSKFRFIGEVTGSQLNSAAANVAALFSAVKAFHPSAVTFAIQPGASTHEDDGTLLAEIGIGTLPGPISATGAGAYGAATGYLIRWNTGAINGGKKVVGRTYFVPMVSNSFQTDGTLLDATRTTVQTAATTFATSIPSPAVNSRSRPGNPAAGNQTVAVFSASVPDKQVVLRSRRD
jgi:hypothetical protein